MDNLIAWLEVRIPGLGRSIGLSRGAELIIGRAERPPEGGDGGESQPIFLGQIRGKPACCIQREEVSREHLLLRWDGAGLRVTVLSRRDSTRIGEERLPSGSAREIPPGALIHLGGDVTLRLCVERDRSRQSFTDPPIPHRDDESELQALLPDIYQGDRQDFLRRFLLIFEALWRPYEWRQDHIDAYFDPMTCPPGMLDWLAGWIGVELAPDLPELARRRMARSAWRLYRDRGTLAGLREMIRVQLGIDEAKHVDIEEGPGFTITVRVRRPPEDRRSAAELRARVKELLAAHKPAHIAYRLEMP